MEMNYLSSPYDASKQILNVWMAQRAFWWFFYLFVRFITTQRKSVHSRLSPTLCWPFYLIKKKPPFLQTSLQHRVRKSACGGQVVKAWRRVLPASPVVPGSPAVPSQTRLLRVPLAVLHCAMAVPASLRGRPVPSAGRLCFDCVVSRALLSWAPSNIIQKTRVPS